MKKVFAEKADAFASDFERRFGGFHFDKEEITTEIEAFGRYFSQNTNGDILPEAQAIIDAYYKKDNDREFEILVREYLVETGKEMDKKSPYSGEKQGLINNKFRPIFFIIGWNSFFNQKTSEIIEKLSF